MSGIKPSTQFSPTELVLSIIIKNLLKAQGIILSNSQEDNLSEIIAATKIAISIPISNVHEYLNALTSGCMNRIVAQPNSAQPASSQDAADDARYAKYDEEIAKTCTDFKDNFGLTDQQAALATAYLDRDSGLENSTEQSKAKIANSVKSVWEKSEADESKISLGSLNEEIKLRDQVKAENAQQDAQVKVKTNEIQNEFKSTYGLDEKQVEAATAYYDKKYGVENSNTQDMEKVANAVKALPQTENIPLAAIDEKVTAQTAEPSRADNEQKAQHEADTTKMISKINANKLLIE